MFQLESFLSSVQISWLISDFVEEGPVSKLELLSELAVWLVQEGGSVYNAVVGDGSGFCCFTLHLCDQLLNSEHLIEALQAVKLGILTT